MNNKNFVAEVNKVDAMAELATNSKVAKKNMNGIDVVLMKKVLSEQAPIHPIFSEKEMYAIFASFNGCIVNYGLSGDAEYMAEHILDSYKYKEFTNLSENEVKALCEKVLQLDGKGLSDLYSRIAHFWDRVDYVGIKESFDTDGYYLAVDALEYYGLDNDILKLYGYDKCYHSITSNGDVVLTKSNSVDAF